MFSSPSDDEVGALQRRDPRGASAAINRAGVVELVDTQDLGSCAFGCEGSSPSFGTLLNCSLRSLWIALESPPTSSSLADEKRVRSLLLSTAARDPGV